MKSLEALREIKSKPFSWEKLKDNLDIIEKELKALEIIKNVPIETHNNVILFICKSSKEAEKIKRCCYESRRND